MHRRDFMKIALGGVSMLALGQFVKVGKAMAADDVVGKVSKTDAEWKAQLSPQQYDVLRHEGTEHPYSSPLNEEHREGIFACAGCGLELFPSKFKFNSGTGWPSFYDSIKGHIETKVDNSLFMQRTEYHCARCGGHQGHIFNDGPQPTGLRHCNNGVALTFIPAKA